MSPNGTFNTEGHTTLTFNLGGSIGQGPSPAIILDKDGLRAASNLVMGVGVPYGQLSLPAIFATGGVQPDATTYGTNTTPVTTEGYVAQIFVPHGLESTGFRLLNGDAVAGNVVVGLYDSTGKRLASAAATAQSGTAAFQSFAWTAPVKIPGPGHYFVIVMFSSTSARFRTHTFGGFRAGKLTGLTAVTLPTQMTIPSGFTASLGPVGTLY